MDQSARKSKRKGGSGDCLTQWTPSRAVPWQNPGDHRSQTSIKSTATPSGEFKRTEMLGGSLTRYHTPVLTKQDGQGLTEDLIKLAGHLVLQQAQAGLQDIQRGMSAADTCANRSAQINCCLKRKAPAMAWVVGKHKAKNTYKRAAKRARDIFGV